jgi:hypothetical protein
LTFDPAAARAGDRWARRHQQLTWAQQVQLELAGTPGLAQLKDARQFYWQQIATIRRHRTSGVINRKQFAEQLAAALGNVAQVQGQITADMKQTADASKKAADKAKQQRQQAAQKAAAAAATFTEPLGLQLAEARATALGKNLRPVLLKMRQAAYRALESHKKSIQGQIDAWNEIASLNDQLKNTLNTSTADFHRRTVASVVKSIHGLNAGEGKRLEQYLAGLGSGYTHRASLALAGAGGMSVGVVHVHGGVKDMKSLEDDLTKRSKGRQHTRRGSR